MAGAVAIHDGPIRVSGRRMGYFPALDGVRGVGIIFVMCTHFISADVAVGAPIWIDLFFVLSGFLITNLLLDEQNRQNSVSLRGFYHRRILRLFPALYAALLVALIILPFVNSMYPQFWAEIVSTAAYSYHIFLAFAGFSTQEDGRVLLHLWTLSVEEWFYLIWPVVLIVGLRSIRRQRLVIVGAALTAAFWWLLRVTAPLFDVSLNGESPDTSALSYPLEVIYRMSVFRYDSLILGCLTAIAMRYFALEPDRPRPRWVTVGGALGLAGLTATMVFGGRWEFWDPFDSLGYNLTILALPFSILFLHSTPTGWWGRNLSTKRLLWIGKRSYGFYIWHQFVNYAVPQTYGKVGIVVRTLFCVAVTFGVGALSWRFIEEPFLKRKDTKYGKVGERGSRTPDEPSNGSNGSNGSGDPVTAGDAQAGDANGRASGANGTNGASETPRAVGDPDAGSPVSS